MALPETHSLPVRARDKVVTLAYGHRKLLIAPQGVISDSRQRVIVSDPGAPAVHVLDPNGVNSFSILAGDGYQLERPGPVAVDGDDNIYIGDSSRAIVLVYDQYGRFLRRIGEFHGENLYQSITGLAIDRKEGRLYLADGARHLVFILDLQGNELKRVGQNPRQRTDEGLTVRNYAAPHEFNYPTDIAVGERAVVVLDSGGTRVRLMDLAGNLTGGFPAIHTAAERADGVGIDKKGNVYVSYFTTSEINVYSQDGLVLGSLGGAGFKFGEFYAPRGLWIDPMGQLYVVDTDNARVQIFQLKSPAALREAVVVSVAAK